MSNEGQEKTFTQADLDALKAEHEKALSELSERHKFEIDRKVDAAIKKTQADAAKAKAFKEYIDKVKKETFETNVKSKVPNTGNQGNTQMASWRKAAGLSEK